MPKKTDTLTPIFIKNPQKKHTTYQHFFVTLHLGYKMGTKYPKTQKFQVKRKNIYKIRLNSSLVTRHSLLIFAINEYRSKVYKL